MSQWEVVFGYKETGETDSCIVEGDKPEQLPDGKLRIGTNTVEFNSGPVISIQEED